MFLSADMVQGNGSGENPYAYVGGNPEIRNDPTGNCAECVAAGIGIGLVVAPEVFVSIIVGEALVVVPGISELAHD